MIQVSLLLQMNLKSYLFQIELFMQLSSYAIRDMEEYKNFCDRPKDQRPLPEEAIGVQIFFLYLYSWFIELQLNELIDFDFLCICFLSLVF